MGKRIFVTDGENHDGVALPAFCQHFLHLDPGKPLVGKAANGARIPVADRQFELQFFGTAPLIVIVCGGADGQQAARFSRQSASTRGRVVIDDHGIVQKSGGAVGVKLLAEADGEHKEQRGGE